MENLLESIKSKKHRKHKSDKKDRHEGIDKQPALKLILKVGGNNSTPEHSNDSPGLNQPLSVSSSYSMPGTIDEESQQSIGSIFTAPDGQPATFNYEKHKKSKKKKKKKDRSKDREKKHKHRKKKRKREGSSQDDEISLNEDSLNETPNIIKRLCPTSLINGEPTGQMSEDIYESYDYVSRTQRNCVIRQREQDRSPLSKLIDYLVKVLEKRDTHQFFAWPVTDLIAPGYSHIITRPMDFSKIKQKNYENLYTSLVEFFNDFKLMCNNAMQYNHVETIYYKAAKKLLHVGTKMIQPEKIRQLRQILPYISEISQEELGFELSSIYNSQNTQAINVESVPTVEISNDEIKTDDINVEMKPELENNVIVKNENEKMEDSPLPANVLQTMTNIDTKKNVLGNNIKSLNFPLSKFEAIGDDMTPDEILDQVTKAAKQAKQKLEAKGTEPQMGFLRQKKDGTTTLNILVGNSGVIEGTNERPISLGALVGKLAYGSGQMQGFKEDRRNNAKATKPLYYGAFGSYAPSYDSTFANLTKEESDLVFQTYGDENAVQYAESILDFAKDCDYALEMVDNLLDILTAGDHRKTKKVLNERKQIREEEELVRKLLEEKSIENNNNQLTDDKIEPEINIDQLKSLSNIGIDVSFLDGLDEQLEKQKVVQENLETTSQLIEKLHQVQNERLSQPPPTHLSYVMGPTEEEFKLADKITDNLTEMTKKFTPGDVVSVISIRKALGMPPPNETISQESAAMDQGHASEIPNNDLENALSEFLENSGTPLSPNVHVSENIEDILI